MTKETDRAVAAPTPLGRPSFHALSEQLTVLSAFSGIGGLDLGLEAAGFRHVGCIEVDEAARRSLKSNRDGRWPLLEPGDITALAKVITPVSIGIEVRELSVLVGGPPCQPFSKAAQWSTSARQGLDDARSHCLSDFLDLVEIFLPSAVVIENVSGFVQGPVTALGMLEQRLTEVNDRHKTHYNVERRVVNAADYGVAQRRSRAILVALRDGGPFIWPTATHTENPVRAWDALIGVDVLGTAPMAVGKWAALLPSIPEGQNYLWHTEQGGGRPLFGYRTRFWSFLLKLAKDQPSWTVSAQPGPATGPFHWDNRPLAIPEMLRLQSFPSDWIVEGDLHDQIRQVGNATPPLLAEEIGRALARQLCNRAFGQVNLVHEIHRARTVPGPGPVAEVPRTYEQLEGKHLAHPGTGKGPRPRAAVGTTRHRPSTT